MNAARLLAELERTDLSATPRVIVYDKDGNSHVADLTRVSGGSLGNPLNIIGRCRAMSTPSLDDVLETEGEGRVLTAYVEWAEKAVGDLSNLISALPRGSAFEAGALHAQHEMIRCGLEEWRMRAELATRVGASKRSERIADASGRAITVAEEMNSSGPDDWTALHVPVWDADELPESPIGTTQHRVIGIASTLEVAVEKTPGWEIRDPYARGGILR